MEEGPPLRRIGTTTQFFSLLLLLFLLLFIDDTRGRNAAVVSNFKSSMDWSGVTEKLEDTSL